MRNTQEQTAYVLQLKKQKETILSKRRKKLMFSATAVCLVLVVGAIALMTNLIRWPFPKDDPSAYETPLLSIDAVLYTPISNRSPLFKLDPSALSVTAGKSIGKVGSSVDADFLSEDSVGIITNFLKKGTDILEWSGYSPEYRVCARDSMGILTGLERVGVIGDMPINRPVTDLFDFKGKVTEILICNNNPSEIGRITDRSVIENLMADFSKHASFVGENKDDAVYVEGQFYRLYLRLADNSNTEIVVNKTSGYGNWIESIKLPESFAAAISEHVLGSMEDEWSNYGNLGANMDPSLLMLDDAGNSLFITTSVWVDGTTGNLFMGDWGGGQINWQCLLANNAKGDIRIEGQNIYYLTLDGTVARIRFAYSGDEASFCKLAESGADLAQFITEREILDQGDFVRLQVRLGNIWTLDQVGTLSCNSESVAHDVKTFALDAAGVSYSDGQAIWRKPYKGDAKKLADTDAVTLTVAGINLYYSPTSGGVWKMRIDGSDNHKVFDLTAKKIVMKFDEMAVLEQNTGKVYITYRDDQIFDTGYLSDDIDLVLYMGLVVIDGEAGKLKSVRYSIEWNGTEYELSLE
jgi:hypothetical protein